MGIYERLVMKKILAIGGAVIKTAQKELIEVIKQDKVEMLIHNGGSIFHDFQIPTDKNLEGHSYPMEDLLKSYKCNKPTADLVWEWLWTSIKCPDENRSHITPKGSVTRLCEDMNIPVLLFTTPGADFWHILNMFTQDWNLLSDKSWLGMLSLFSRFKKENFHFVNMGSAVMHPEIFIKAIALAKPNRKNFKADVVDFKEMYRPRTRVAQFGNYFKMTHKEYLEYLLKGKV